VVPALAKQIADAARTGAGELRTGNLDARRDLSDVRDVVRAYRELLVSGVPGEVYNVCSGSAFSIRAVAELMLKVAEVDLRIVVDPARVRSVEIPELRGDRSRLEAATGWLPAIPLERTLADVIAYWQQQPQG
jgi:GDP-4-dehydro-6-deoxy-D-mannose reductase